MQSRQVREGEKEGQAKQGLKDRMIEVVIEIIRKTMAELVAYSTSAALAG